MEVVFGSNPNYGKVPPFSSRSQTDDGRAETAIRIIVVEDNRADVWLIREAVGLQALSASLHVLDDGEQAIQFINDADQGAEKCPQLMVLDLNLPRKTGKEVLIHLRRSRTCAKVPVLVVTSSSVDKEEMERLGGNGYFQKPTDYDQYMKVGQMIKSMLQIPGNS